MAAVNNSLSLEQTVGRRLQEARMTLATAESCSGGLIAHRITEVPGASNYFYGGVVAYSNEVKVRLLGVNRVDLTKHGAVSEVVAIQMAQGVKDYFDADWGIGVTGVAGPTGGTDEKPVGLVFISVAGGGQAVVERHQFSGSRSEVNRQTADRAFQLLLERLG